MADEERIKMWLKLIESTGAVQPEAKQIVYSDSRATSYAKAQAPVS